ncbi:MAG: DUF4434 domain-containing protein [Pirellulaceae bacterium]|jgi:hypothetical protein|nr:DUF4434 domain-containing protein [Pirellulaceae bacterium]
MGNDGISRRQFVAGAAGIAGMFNMAGQSCGQATQACRVPDDEVIRVAADQWHFETAKTQQRFIPLGANLTRTSKEDLDIFGPRYDGEQYEEILAACEQQNITVLKVFLPIGLVLPDPQAPGEARIAPGYLDNLDDFLARAGRHHVRAIIALASWHGTGIKWWHEGGQYFGRKPWKEDAGQDSIATLCDFWRQLGDHLQGHPAVFAYTMCVEWTMPCGNLTGPWQPASEEVGLVPGDTALWYWRRWVMSKYGSLSDVNDVYGASFAKVEDIPVVDYAYDKATKTYASPDSMILDYQNYREWTTLRYFRPQIAALRAADDTHLVTISNHMRSWNLWEGAARHFLGYTPAEQYPYVDFFTYHANYDINDFANDRPEMEAPYEVAVQARLACAAGVKPVIIEEYTFATESEEHTSRMQAAILRTSVGDASGWVNWYLQYPDGAGAADAAHESAWLRRDLQPTAWGEEGRAILDELCGQDLDREAAVRTVKLDRKACLVPRETSPLITDVTQYKKTPQPVDYVVEHEPDLDLTVLREMPGEGALRCKPVISGNLRPYQTQPGMDVWERDMDDERALGFDLLWLSHIRPALDAPGDIIGGVLDICAERKMQVILGIGSTPNWYGPLDAKREIEVVGATVHEIGQRYGSHPAFHGWYVPHEIYMTWERMSKFIDTFYPAAVEACKAAADKLVTLSPFFILDRAQIFGNYRFNEPAEYQDYWSRLIQLSKFDVIMLQDSGEHMAFCTNAQRKPFFEAMKSACDVGGAKLWGNVECAEFNVPSIETYIERYGRTHHGQVKNAPWRVVPMPRLESKLRLAATYAERIVTWGYYQYGRPQLSPEAKAWYEEYKAYMARVGGVDAPPASGLREMNTESKPSTRILV